MKGNYRQVLDGFALNSLHKLPNIPDFHLMVGSAERLDGLPLLLYENAVIPNHVIGNMNTIQNGMNNEEIQQAIADNELEINDLNWNTALLGGGLGV